MILWDYTAILVAVSSGISRAGRRGAQQEEEEQQKLSWSLGAGAGVLLPFLMGRGNSLGLGHGHAGPWTVMMAHTLCARHCSECFDWLTHLNLMITFCGGGGSFYR